MTNTYRVVEVDGSQIVQNVDTQELYLTVDSYSKMAGSSPESVENRAKVRCEVVDLGEESTEDIQGRYLIPIKLVYYWLLTDCPLKAHTVGAEAIAASIAQAFSALPKP